MVLGRRTHLRGNEPCVSKKITRGDMSIHKIRVEFLVLTDQRKTLFLRWALEGFKSPKSPLQMAHPKLSEKAG
jgi:hypothetical protein